MTIKQVKTDLEEIKYYYANQKDFDAAARSVGESAAAQKAKRYNEAVTQAPAQIYGLYVALYVNGSTQLEYALDIGKCADQVCRNNQKLYKFFADYFNVD